MKLNVVNAEAGAGPWYADGLKFTCTQCGNCCTVGPGYVWLSKVEIVRLAEFLKISPQETVERYCRKIDGRFSLKEYQGPGGYDCVFLKYETDKTKPMGTGCGSAAGEVTYTRRYCSVYSVRPLQCRTWPFWEQNLDSREAWDHAARRCHGMNAGDRHFTRERIEELRDSKDWPDSPPTSASPK